MHPDPPSVARLQAQSTAATKQSQGNTVLRIWDVWGKKYFCLKGRQQRDKINVKRDVVEQYVFLLFWPLPITPMEKCYA